jgi:hypothetical protein
MHSALSISALCLSSPMTKIIHNILLVDDCLEDRETYRRYLLREITHYQLPITNYQLPIRPSREK